MDEKKTNTKLTKLDVYFWVVVLFIVAVALSVIATSGKIAGNPDVFGLADVVENVRPGVVHITKKGVCQGSGFVGSADGVVVTAKHVTDGGGEFIVTLDDGRTYETTEVVEDKMYDVAFLFIKPEKPLYIAKMADSRDMRVGQSLFIMGSPFGEINFNSVSLGILSSKSRSLTPYMWNDPYGWEVLFQSDSAANPGNSGGPVFNMNGEVIGVLVAGISEGVNYSVPTFLFKDLLEQVKLVHAMDRWEIASAPGWEEQSGMFYGQEGYINATKER